LPYWIDILPLLNNLLENREMQLEDGRFLMSPNRYDDLLKDNKYTKEELVIILYFSQSSNLYRIVWG
jgi:hypothetical protein